MVKELRMRAQFVRKTENPLDTLGIGRISERELKKKIGELKSAARILIHDFNLDINTLTQYSDSISFSGIMNKQEVRFWLGYDIGKNSKLFGKIKSFYAGYEDLYTNEINSSHNETIGECMNLIKKWLYGSTFYKT